MTVVGTVENSGVSASTLEFDETTEETTSLSPVSGKCNTERNVVYLIIRKFLNINY